MNSLNRINSNKIAVLVATAGISALISLPATAQSNPRPSIFNEPPYNRSYGPPQGPQPNRQSGQGHQPAHGHHKHHQPAHFCKDTLFLWYGHLARPPLNRRDACPTGILLDENFIRGTYARKAKTKQEKFAGIVKLLSDRRILTFAIAVVLFHFANAAMLPLVGQLLDQGGKGKGVDGTVYMSACIIVAQLVMVPSANLAGRLAEGGRKRVFLIGFAVLPIRGVPYTLSHNPFFLVFVQILDGVAGGIFGVLSVLMVADLTKGTGRFNVTQGMLATSIGIGAGLSNLIAGFVVQKAGYNVGFLMLAAIAVVALGVFWFLVSETKDAQNPKARAATVPQ